MTTPLLELDGVSKTFFRGRAPRVDAVSDLSLRVERGECLGIVGESGSGKSTLARLMLRLIQPSDGRVLFDGMDWTRKKEREIRPHRGRLQIVFQDPQASLDPRMRVGAIIEEPLRASGLAPVERARRVSEALDLVELPQDALRRFPHAFSGGQRQRIGIARALVSRPELLVCDEATSALDSSIQAQILNLLQDVRARLGLTLVFISHNLAVVRHLSDRIAVMYRGRIVERAPEGLLFDSPRHPYTRALLDAVLEPGLDGAGRRLPEAMAISADARSADPAGCDYLSRCPFAREECSVAPELREVEAGHRARCHFAHDPAMLESAP